MNKVHLPVLCPSARCEPGAILLGIVQEDGRACLIGHQIIIDQAFVETARMGRRPEKRFRFASACVQGACKQWVNDRCGVIDAVIHDIGGNCPPGDLPECSVRDLCRWYRQRGREACEVCQEVITDLHDAAGNGQASSTE